MGEILRVAIVFTAAPRFGMRSAYVSARTVTTPSGLSETVTTERTATLANLADPLSATLLVETRRVNGGGAFTIVEDPVGHTMTMTSPLGRKTTIGTDARGRVTALSIPGLNDTTLQYDSTGRLSQSTMSERTVTMGYDPSNGYLKTITDPFNRVRTFGTDAVGRVTSQGFSNGDAVGLGYDADGNVQSVAPPGQPSHGFSFYPGDLSKSYDPPALQGVTTPSTLIRYDADDRIAMVTGPDGGTIVPTYDPATGRVTSLTAPHGVTTIKYDPVTGQIQNLTAPGNVITAFKYDGFLLRDTTYAGPFAATYHRDYDATFRVKGDSLNGANAVAYVYDADGILTNAGDEVLTPDPRNGALIGTTLGKVSDVTHYSPYGEPQDYAASFDTTALYAVTFARDTLGRVSTKTETVSGQTTSYGYDYDARDRLWHTYINGALAATYDYDANGNRRSVTTPRGIVTGSYDAQDRLRGYDGATYTYGANGELQTKSANGQTTTFKYDAFGNLREVDLPGKKIEYVIDGENRRVAKKVNGNISQGWIYRDGLKPIGEVDGFGKIVARFVYGSKSWIPDYVVRAAGTYRIVSDSLGSPRVVVDALSGSVVQALDYDEFGNVLSDTNPGFQPFGFAGGIYDRDTALVRFGARDYDPSTGRWTTKDQSRFDGGLNFYVYADNDAVNLVDPTGFVVGKAYSTPEGAGLAALDEYMGYSTSLGREIGGQIYEANGSYFHTNGVLGTSLGTAPGLAPVPSGGSVVADWHTHVRQPGKRTIRKEWCGDVEQPFSRPPQSSNDLQGAWEDGRHFIMVGTPSGHVGFYYPHSGGSFEWYMSRPAMMAPSSPADPVIRMGSP